MTEQAFLQGIKENPTDNSRHLVYADWLDEQGRKKDADKQRRFQHVKHFTTEDVRGIDEEFPRIYVDTKELLNDPLWWHEKGLQQTTSGYGGKLTNPSKISYNGKFYRIYTTIFSNNGSSWFTVKGKKIYVS